MRKHGIAIAASFALALGGCAALPPDPSPFTPQPPPPRLSPPPPPLSNDPSPVGMPGLGSTAREFAGPDTYLAPMPTAVVLLIEEHPTRNATFCDEFRKFTDANDPRSDATSQFTNRVLTRWPLVKRITNERLQTCHAMLDDYDFARAKRLLARFVPPTGTAAPGTAGPYFMQFLPDGAVILVDGSGAKNNEELREWTRGWLSNTRSQITYAKAQRGPDGDSTSSSPDGGSASSDNDVPWWNNVGPDVAKFIHENVPFGRTLLGILKATARSS